MDALASPRFVKGMRIQGKWNRRLYRVEGILGEGANGIVYLVSGEGGVAGNAPRAGTARMLRALKVGFDPLDMQSEVNVLQALSRIGGSFKGYLVDVDDVQLQTGSVSFYVMKYVEGRNLSDYLLQKGADWYYLLGQNLLAKLMELHEQGYIFGDLKMENLIVTTYGEMELIDFGGVTEKGRSVKQFTEIYDRGYWQAGARIADAGYDLFSFAVLFLQLAAGEKWRVLTRQQHLRENRSTAHLLELLNGHHTFAGLVPFFQKCLAGGFVSAEEALKVWKEHFRNLGNVDRRPTNARWLKLCFVCSFLLLSLAVVFWRFG